MAHINTIQLIHIATNVGSVCNRAHEVQQDPAVRKAWHEAGGDLTRLLGSTSRALDETRAAWRRVDPA